jgi:DMSO/TMAO reductase YedYZ molybdopterin-dependent catalytic subunit
MIAALAITSSGLHLELVTGSVNSPNAEIASAYPEWQLRVTGLVENPLNLSWAELVALPQTTVYAQLICVDWPNQVLISGNWTGVKLRLLLETAGISPQAIKVGFLATDDFTTDLTMETAMRDDVILAYELNGEPLDVVLRLVVPGKWGYKWIHHVGNIELLDYNFLGFWESRGYSDEADAYLPSVPPGNIPEFPTILFFVIAAGLIALVTVIVKKKVEKHSTHTFLSEIKRRTHINHSLP